MLIMFLHTWVLAAQVPPAVPAPTTQPAPAEPPALQPLVAPPASAPPAANAVPPRLRVVVVACDGAPGAAESPATAMAQQRLVGTGRVDLVPAAGALLGKDATALAVLGAASGAEKVVCVAVQSVGTGRVVATQFVDTHTAELEFTRVQACADTPAEVTRVLDAQAQAVTEFVLQGFAAAAPSVAQPPIPEAAPVPPDSGSSARLSVSVGSSGKPNAWLGAGVALLTVGAALLPATLAAVALGGAGHMAGNAVMLVPPGEKAPAYYSPYFTLTWGDALVGALGILAGLSVMAVGAGLVVLGVVL